MTEAKTEHTLELIEAARLLKFNAATGWPQTFAHDKLAALQTWHKGIERKDWFKEAATWQELLRLVVESDAMEHTTTTERVQVTLAIRRTINPGFASQDWDRRGFAGAQVESRSFLGGTLVTGYTQPARDTDVTRHHIAAPAFAAWLAARGKEPAPLVAAWFKAQGVACPAPAPAQHAATPAPVVGDSASNARVVPFKKAALIAAHVHEWPTIERDISDANANGLATAAKADARGWREADALTWARAKGKLIRAAKPADSLTQAMHNLGALPSRKHTMQG